MKASETLSIYGLDAFGVDAAKANPMLIRFVSTHEGGVRRGRFALDVALDSLLQKMEAIDDGRSTGFRISGDEASVLDILIETGARYRVRREGLSVLPV